MPPLSKVDKILHEFFIKDGVTEEGFVRKSVLLQILRDLEFNLGIGKGGWVSLQLEGLNEEQEKIKKKMLPLLTPVLLFCSVVDLLARVELGRIARQGENGEVFKRFLIDRLGFDDVKAEIMWNFRCSLSHQYIIPGNVALHRAGSREIIEKVSNRDNLWFIYVHPMYTTLANIKNQIY